MVPDHNLINKSNNTEVDLEAHPKAKELVTRCQQFFSEIEDLTPGKALEEKLNTNYGPGTAYYEDFCRLIRAGLTEGWVANIEIDGPRYRRSKISQPKESTRYFSITTVYMDSSGSGSTQKPTTSQDQGKEKEKEKEKLGYIDDGEAEGEGEEEEEYAGNYHAHPYGEINCVVQIDEGAQLRGMQGWQGKGWTSPGPGTHHFPVVRRGALVALFFLPAGRIAYNVKPGELQPHCV